MPQPSDHFLEERRKIRAQFVSTEAGNKAIELSQSPKGLRKFTQVVLLNLGMHVLADVAYVPLITTDLTKTISVFDKNIEAGDLLMRMRLVIDLLGVDFERSLINRARDTVFHISKLNTTFLYFSYITLHNSELKSLITSGRAFYSDKKNQQELLKSIAEAAAAKVIEERNVPHGNKSDVKNLFHKNIADEDIAPLILFALNLQHTNI